MSNMWVGILVRFGSENNTKKNQQFSQKFWTIPGHHP